MFTERMKRHRLPTQCWRRGRQGAILRLALLLGMLSIVTTGLRAETLGGELRAMRLEVERLRAEVDLLKQEVRELKDMPRKTELASTAPVVPAAPEATGNTNAASPAQDQTAQPSPEEAIPLLQAQVAEQAQTKVESNSRMPVKIFGTVVSTAFFNTGEANWLDNPNVVGPPPASGLPQGSFSISLRQSRLGAMIDGPEIGSMKVRGFVAVDFFGGVTNFQTGQVMGLPRLLYGFVRLEGARTSVEVGQDHMMLAPQNPTSLAAMSFPELYRAGNLYLRVPQMRVEHTFDAGKPGQIIAMGGIVAPIAGDFNATAPTFVPPNLAGERSRMPAFQGRLAWRARPSGPAEDRGWELGFSGHYGRERFITGGVPSWATALDFDAHAGRVGLGGEFYVGRNLAAFGGSLGQFAKSTGGFVEGRLKATQRLEFNGGFGRDRLFDLSALPAPLVGNTGVYANTIFRWTPELASSFEYRWLSTDPASSDARRNNHLNFVLAYSF